MEARNSARAVLLNYNNEILLFKFEFAGLSDGIDSAKKIFWITPGGKLEEGEGFSKALQREIKEEVGLSISEIGPWIWTRNAKFDDKNGAPFLSYERYYLVRVVDHELDTTNMTENEKLTLKGYKWWSLDELKQVESSLRPPGLLNLVADIAEGNVPGKPVEIG